MRSIENWNAFILNISPTCLKDGSIADSDLEIYAKHLSKFK